MAKLQIQAPNTKITEKIANIQFVDGKAEIDEDNPQVNYFLGAGYIVTGFPQEVAGTENVGREGAPAVTPKPLTQLKLDELRALAAQKGVQVPDKATKADIIDLLSGRDAADAHEPAAQVSPNSGVDGSAPDDASTPPAGTTYGNKAAGSDENNRDEQGVPA